MPAAGASELAQYGDRLLPEVLGARCIHYFKPYRLHRTLCRLFARAVLHGQNRLQIWTVDPQVGKTSSVMACILWYLEWFPDRNVIYWTYNDERGGEIGSDIRNLFEDNQDILRTRLRQDTTAKNRWRTEQGGGFISRTRFKGFPGNVVFIDDPFADMSEFLSAAHRERVWRRYQADVLDRLHPDTIVITVMTRGNDDDLVGRMKRHAESHPDSPQWHHVHIPALADPNVADPDPLGRSPGEPTVPEIHPREARLRTKGLSDDWTWWTTFMGVPTAPTGQKFLRDYWRHLTAGVPPEKRIVTISSWDLTFGSTSGSGSWVVGQKWTLDHTGRYCLLDQTRDRAEYHDQKAMFRRFRERHRDIQFDLIENKALAAALISDLGTEQWYRQLGGQVVPINVPPGKGKEVRAEANLGLFADGRIWVPSPGIEGYDASDGWVEDVISEHALFPSEPNDIVDTASQAIKWLRDYDPAEQGTGLQAVSYR